MSHAQWRHVSALHASREGWQGASVLEHRGEPTGFLSACRAEASALPSGNQRQPESRLVPVHRSFRRASGRVAAGGTFSGGSTSPRYVQLTEIEAVFRALKSDLAIRPIHHQKDSRIEAHIFVSFLAYCLYVTLRQRLRALAPGLTPRAVLEKMSAIQMVDVRVPTTDGRLLILPRYTQPETDHQMLLHELHLQLPAQPPPRILQQELESVVEGENL